MVWKKGYPSRSNSGQWANIHAGMILPMAFPIAIYEELAELSRRMLEAAEAGDSAEFVRLSDAVEALGKEEIPDETDAVGLHKSRLYRNALRQRILDNDAKIRRLTSPLPNFLDELLAGNSGQLAQSASRPQLRDAGL